MTVYFTADQHFGHRNIIGYCDRTIHSVGEMNAALVANWNAVVGPHDAVHELQAGRVERAKEGEALSVQQARLVEELEPLQLYHYKSAETAPRWGHSLGNCWSNCVGTLAVVACSELLPAGCPCGRQ